MAVSRTALSTPWGVSFLLTGRKSYGNAPTLDEAKAAFKAEYEIWLTRPDGKTLPLARRSYFF